MILSRLYLTTNIHSLQNAIQMCWSVIVEIFFVAFVGASLTNLFDDSIQPGMLLEKWGKIVEGNFWLKPLGGCIICTTPWVTLIISGIYMLSPFVFYPIALVAISNTILKFIIR